jgi:hypothetical protein
MTLYVNGSIHNLFVVVKVMNVFGYLGHKGCILMIKLSKITREI